MADLPEPLVPAEVDLRDFQYMELDVRRMRDSRIVATVDGEEFRAAFLLWCAAWHQVPAGSVPDDDVELASLAGYGRVVREWKKVRTGALYGFVKCSDGRLYHPTVCEKAAQAWESKLRHAHGKMAERTRKLNVKREKDKLPAIAIPSFEDWNSAGRTDPVPPENSKVPPEGPGRSAGIPPENALRGNRTERRGNGEGTEIPIHSAPDGAGGQAAVEPADVIFGRGIPLLTAAGVADRNARSMLGLMRKQHGDAAVIDALQRCAEERPLEPVAWLQRALKVRAGPAARASTRQAQADAASEEALRLLAGETMGDSMTVDMEPAR